MSVRSVAFAIVAVLLASSCSASDTTTPTVATVVPAASTTTATGTVTSTTTTVAAPTTTASTMATTAAGASSAHLATFIEERAAEDGFSGAALIGRDDEVIWHFASGPANRDENRANELDTKFNLGSINKLFTAVAVLQLMEQGKLELTDTIADHLPDYPNAAVGEGVTIHHLLTNTSGMGDTFTAEFNADPNRYRTNADYLPLFVDDPLLFDPGEAFGYSNAGFVILGFIIEAVSGQDYYDYVRTAIFEPAGMVDTDSYLLEDDVPNLAMGYTTRDINGVATGVLAENAPLMPGRGFAAGGGYSTTEDLFRFRNALLGHRLLTAESTRELITARAEMAPGIEYGYGVIIRDEEGSVGHTGGAPGICSFLSMYPDTGYTVIVLSNSDEDCLPVLEYLRSNPLG